MEPIKVYGFSTMDMLKQMYHGRNMPPIRVYGISNWDVAKSLGKEVFKDFYKVLLIYITVLAAGAATIARMEELNEYCRVNNCEANSSSLNVKITPSTTQNKTLDLMVE